MHTSEQALRAAPPGTTVQGALTPCNSRPLAPWQHKLQRPVVRQQDLNQQVVPPLPLPALPSELQHLVQHHQHLKQKQNYSNGQHQHVLLHTLCTLEHPALTAKIKRCHTWHELAILFAQQAPCLNCINLSALLVQLAHLETNSSSSGNSSSSSSSSSSRPVNWRAFLQQVLTTSQPLLGQAAPRQLSNMAWALAKLDFHDWATCISTTSNSQAPHNSTLSANAHNNSSSSSWSVEWQQHVLRCLHQASCRDVSNILWALATSTTTKSGAAASGLAAPGPANALGTSWTVDSRQQQQQWQQQQHEGRLVQEVLSALHRTLPNSTPQDVANSLWALATLRLQPTPELLHFLLVRAQAHFAAFKPREVATVLWSLAQLQAAPPAPWLHECLTRHVGRPAWLGTQPRHYVMCLVACAHLKLVPPTPWLVECLQQLQQHLLLLQPHHHDSSTSSSKKPHTSNTPSKNTSQDLSNTIWALARLRVRPNAAWVDDFLGVSAASLAGSSPQELSNTIWALAKLRVVPDGAWLAAFDAASLARMGHFSPQGLADILAAQVHLGQQPSGAWREAWICALRDSWGSADAAAICKALWAAARLQLPLGRAWLAEALQQAHGSVIQPALAAQSVSCEELLRLMWAVGRLCRGKQSQELSNLLGLCCCRAAGKMSGQQLARGAWGLARLVPLPREGLVSYFYELAESRVKYLPEEQGAEVTAKLQLLKDAAVKAHWLGSNWRLQARQLALEQQQFEEQPVTQWRDREELSSTLQVKLLVEQALEF